MTRPLPILLLVACAQGAAPPPAAPPARALAKVASLGTPALEAPSRPEDRLTISHDPAVLQVYRSTRVRLTAALPAAHRGAKCRWSFGGGAALAVGQGAAGSDACSIEHTFIGGTADERVTVVASDGAWSETATRILPLERLPVSTRPVALEPSAHVPEKPNGPEDFRLVVMADSAGVEEAALATLSRRIIAAQADLVVHLGGHAQDGQEWTRLRETLAEGLRAADIPLLPAIAPADLEVGAEVRRPLGKGGEQLDLVDGAAFPERWALSFNGVFMAFVSGAEQSAGALDWLRERLAEAQIYESRLVFSYLPLHPFGERVPAGDGPHTLGPKFKVYELLLRARTTALLSAGHHVYFKGRYGALPVVSVGSVAAGGPSGGSRLLGHDAAQPASLVVIDIAHGQPQRVFALVADADGTPFSVPFDESYLPETVEVYTR